jgi:hypothetical protein
MLQKSRKLLAITLTLALSLYVAPLAFAQMAGHDGGGTTGAHHDGGTGGGTGNGHHLNDGHTHNPVGNGNHFTGDGHNHSAGHKGHDHGGMVKGVNHFSARGTVVVEPTANPADPTAPVTMTVNLQQANSRLRDLVGTDVELTISPNAYVMIAGVGPGVLENILADDMVKVMGSIVKSKDGTTLIYEATQIVVY